MIKTLASKVIIEDGYREESVERRNVNLLTGWPALGLCPAFVPIFKQ